jgi:3-methylcrotonyl-CoA carboxylase alpha subunit
MKTLLIANRGEIACRIMRTAKKLGLRTVAVYSEADANALHVRSADVAYCIGPAQALQSYLHVPALIDAIRATGADAVHPGYGFLSENEDFAAAVVAAGAVWVGPDAYAIRVMGSKIEAKRAVAGAGAPVVPGYNGDDQSESTLFAEAKRTGFPLLIKASAGGGGKGMRIVRSAEEFAEALAGARREAKNAFSDDRVLLERYLPAPKHIEVQVLADRYGNTIYLHERDCSVQRRHQKVIEEAPGPTIDAVLRQRLGKAAVTAAKSVNYVGAGTVEFIAEAGEFYFMEMNTRLQVEHPVTEAITGLDLVEWQLRIAAGERLTLLQRDVRLEGHAVEARIYAENPARRFLPSTGRLLHAAFPLGVRIDAGVETGDSVGIHYDPMIAKVIAHGATRQEAIGRLRAALSATRLCGLSHNTGYLVRALAVPDFVEGRYTTGFCDRHHEMLVAADDQPALVAAALAASRFPGPGSSVGAWNRVDGFTPNLAAQVDCRLAIGAQTHTVAVPASGFEVPYPGVSPIDAATVEVRFRHRGVNRTAAVHVSGVELHVMLDGDTVVVRDLDRDIDRFVVSGGSMGGIVAPLPGQVLEVRVKPGDRVRSGDVLVIVEAMKMEHLVRAPEDGVVETVGCSQGARVEEGMVLVSLRPDD